jgi:hypothetical protein
VLNKLGLVLTEAGRPEEALVAFQDAAAIFRETGDRHRREEALGNLNKIPRRGIRSKLWRRRHTD